MAEYNMQELNLPGEDGKRILYPRMKLYGQVDLETITEKIAYASSFTRGDIIGLVQAITDEIAYQMGQGYSVKIDNLGVFTPALGLRQDRERETGEEGDTKRNAVSICLKDIHFKVDKELLYRTARHCHLKRSTDKFQRSSQVFSPQERLERAKKYLEKNSFMTQADYCQLTGLLKSAASRELREWIANPESGIDYIDYIRSMINDGVCEIAPGGGFHTEEWYGHLNGGGVASVIMPLWYMGRFTDYCSDLDGKMAIYPIPVWNEGDTREVLQGGTGTSVIKGTENEQLAKDFLAFAKLSKEGCTYEWEKLGFDPIRTELWDDPAITENKDNKFLAYFTTNPFDILKENGTDITAPNISGSYSATYSTLVSTTYSNAFEISVDQDAKELLQSEQDSIIY